MIKTFSHEHETTKHLKTQCQDDKTTITTKKVEERLSFDFHLPLHSRLSFQMTWHFCHKKRTLFWKPTIIMTSAVTSVVMPQLEIQTDSFKCERFLSKNKCHFLIICLNISQCFPLYFCCYLIRTKVEQVLITDQRQKKK